MAKSYRTKVEQGDDGEFYVTIPRELLDSLGWDVGTEVEMSVEDGAIVIRKAEG